MARTATCRCGQLRLACPDSPIRVSLCHCMACQQRTGSVFSVQARFGRDDIEFAGEAAEYRQAGDSGEVAVFRFCPQCGSTVWWSREAEPNVVLVAVGAFADPGFPPPQVIVYEERRHAWCDLLALARSEHHV